MIVVLIFTLFPFYWLMLTSVQPKEDLMNSPPKFSTDNPTLQTYGYAIRETLKEFMNSLAVAFSTTIIAVLFGATSAYCFARYKIGGSSLPFWILSLKFFPPVVAIVPFFLMMNTFRLIDTRMAVIIPHLILTVPFAVWMIKGFIQEVPRELEEAAMIDGCSQLNVIRIVTLPLIAPGLVVTALFCFIWSWNDFMFALVLTRNQAMTIPVAIAGMRDPHGLMWGEVSATAALGTLPIIALAILLQKYLVRGLSLGSLK
jgi:ABC-type glycerol-3-phosphate transport system permease component